MKNIFSFFALLSLSYTLLFTLTPAPEARAAAHFTATLRGRSLPQSVNAVGELAYDTALWGDPSKGKDDPMFGFASIGTRFGGSPSVSAFVQIAPISPLVIEAQRSMTQRFTRTTNFPCDSVECKGRIDRTDFSVQLGGAWKEFVFLGGYLWRDLKTMDAATPVMIELEDLVVTPGNHRYQEGTFFAGRTLEKEQTLGVLYMAGEITAASSAFQGTYLMYRANVNEYLISVAAGNYKSDFENLNGFSALLNVSRQFGETMSLF